MSSLSERLREKGVDMETERKLEQVCSHVINSMFTLLSEQLGVTSLSRGCNLAVKLAISSVVNRCFQLLQSMASNSDENNIHKSMN